MSWTIEFYRNKNGKSPVEEFLIDLDKKTAVKVYGAIKLLKKHGIYRILYFAASGKKFVLLHGLVKK